MDGLGSHGEGPNESTFAWIELRDRYEVVLWLRQGKGQGVFLTKLPEIGVNSLGDGALVQGAQKDLGFIGLLIKVLPVCSKMRHYHDMLQFLVLTTSTFLYLRFIADLLWIFSTALGESGSRKLVWHLVISFKKFSTMPHSDNGHMGRSRGRPFRLISMLSVGWNPRFLHGMIW